MRPRAEQTVGDTRRFEAAGGWAVAYATNTRRLVVTIPRNPTPYVYLDVPPDEYQLLLAAPNMGAAFALFRKAGYAFSKVALKDEVAL